MIYKDEILNPFISQDEEETPEEEETSGEEETCK